MKANLGNNLNSIVNQARFSLFNQGELAQLTYSSFDGSVRQLQDSELTEFTIKYPIGYRPDKTTINLDKVYDKLDLISKYAHLALNQLAINGIIQFVTIMEAMLCDILRTAILCYPNKLGNKRSIQLQYVLESTSLEDIHLKAVDLVLNELSYKSPIEFSQSLQELISVNLLECPGFHKYMEIKASRDIYIHNGGVANEIYQKKSGVFSRAKNGESLHSDIDYYLNSYEACIQITEWLEEKLHETWFSSNFEERRNSKEAKD